MIIVIIEKKQKQNKTKKTAATTSKCHEIKNPWNKKCEVDIEIRNYFTVEKDLENESDNDQREDFKVEKHPFILCGCNRNKHLPVQSQQ